MTDAPASVRRRRSDARRSIDAILNAARVVLGERPDAGMEDIAAAAGVTRQTVYAHFASRNALLAALVQAAGAEAIAALDAADLDVVPPAEALRRYLEIGWQLIENHPYLLDAALARNPPGSAETHHTGTAQLEAVVRRGQTGGDFNTALPADWLAVAIVGLVRTAAEQFIVGRLTNKDAPPLILKSALVLCGAASPRDDRSSER
jgi:AcrR family transcriptional regulator